MAEQKKDNAAMNLKDKMTLIELLTILLMVGLVFVFVVPVSQARASQTKINQAIETMNMVGEKADAFKNNPDNGYYPDLSQLNLGSAVDTTYFRYTINTDDSTLVAVTKKEFGKKDAYLVYNLSTRQFSIGNPKDEMGDVISKKYINENWLP